MAGQDETEIDIYALELNSGQVQRLTSGGGWNETGHFSRDDKKIVWLSNNGYPIDTGSTARFWWEQQKTDYWTMNSDGSAKTQVTYYNKKGTPDWESVGGRRTMAEYATWSAGGTRLVGGLVIDNNNGNTSDKIVLIDLNR